MTTQITILIHLKTYHKMSTIINFLSNLLFKGPTGISGPTGMLGNTGMIGNTGMTDNSNIVQNTGTLGNTGMTNNRNIVENTGVLGKPGMEGPTGEIPGPTPLEEAFVFAQNRIF